MYCWGASSYGQLGFGASDPISEPSRLPLDKKIVKVDAGIWHSIALAGIIYMYY